MEKENKQLKRDNIKFQAEIVRKEEQLEKMKIRYENLNESYATKVERMNDTIAKLRTNNDKLVSNLSNVRAKQVDVRGKLDEKMSGRTERQKQRIDKLKSKITELSTEIKSLKEYQAEIMGNTNEHMSVSVQIFDRKEIVKLMTMETIMGQIKNPDFKKVRLTAKDNFKYREIFNGTDSPEDVFIGGTYLFNPKNTKIEKMTYSGSAISSNFINKIIMDANTEDDSILCEKLEAAFKEKIISEKAVSRQKGIENTYVTQTTYVAFNKKYKIFVFMTIYN